MELSLPAKSKGEERVASLGAYFNVYNLSSVVFNAVLFRLVLKQINL